MAIITVFNSDGQILCSLAGKQAGQEHTYEVGLYSCECTTINGLLSTLDWPAADFGDQLHTAIDSRLRKRGNT